jgi:hypothetical protein
MVAAVAGCTDSLECKRAHRVVLSDGNEPGTLRAATVFQAAFPAIAPLSNGSVVCLTCTGFMVMDRTLDVQYEGGEPPYNVAVGSDDTIYVVQLPNGYKTKISEAPVIDLVAFEPGGALRWRQPLPGGSFTRPLAAVPQGVYVETSGGVALFAAATGEGRAVSSQSLLAADHNGLFTMTLPDHHTLAPEVTIRRLAATGAMQWERTWKSPEGVVIFAAVTTPEGGLIVAGGVQETIDFGDRTLSDPVLGDFLVAIDASGTTQWAYALSSHGLSTEAFGLPSYLALMPSGDVLLAGERSTGQQSDAYLAVASPTGVVRTHRIEGAADQRIHGLAAGSDGVAWLEVANQPIEGESDVEMRFGGHEFHEPDIYVFAIVP